MNVFVSGSRTIKRLDENIVNVIFDELNSDAKIFVGDADGVDAEIQRFCNNQQYRNVIVFALNGKARNNVGSFPVHEVYADKNVFYKEFYAQKDIVMTEMADYGIVIWDEKSKGSLNNIIRLLKHNKPCRVYLANSLKWVAIENEVELERIKPLSVRSKNEGNFEQLSLFS